VPVQCVAVIRFNHTIFLVIPQAFCQPHHRGRTHDAAAAAAAAAVLLIRPWRGVAWRGSDLHNLTEIGPLSIPPAG